MAPEPTNVLACHLVVWIYWSALQVSLGMFHSHILRMWPLVADVCVSSLLVCRPPSPEQRKRMPSPAHRDILLMLTTSSSCVSAMITPPSLETFSCCGKPSYYYYYFSLLRRSASVTVLESQPHYPQSKLVWSKGKKRSLKNCSVKIL